jgi:hypothetical protein
LTAICSGLLYRHNADLTSVLIQDRDLAPGRHRTFFCDLVGDKPRLDEGIPVISAFEARGVDQPMPVLQVEKISVHTLA